MMKSYFSKRDRQAIVALTLLILAISGFLWVLGDYGRRHGDANSQDSSYVQRRYYSKGERRKAGGYYAQASNVRLFKFDPNTADSTALLKLGLQPWQVRNIYKYRSHGGTYRKPEDFARLYGLSAHQYKQLLPYISIDKEYSMTAAEYVGADGNHKGREENFRKDSREGCKDKAEEPVVRRKIALGEHVVLNTADTTELKRVPGIGSWYAKAIVRYGERLGGYVSIDQLDEIEGFPEEAKQYFVVSNPSPHKMNVNTLTLSQLRQHPYINYYQAKAITDYRRIHGNIKTLQQLSTSPDFTAKVIRKLLPYVAF